MKAKHLVILILALLINAKSFGQWTKVYENLNQSFQDIFFTSDSVGYAVGGESFNAVIVKTTDAGQTWNTIYTTAVTFLSDVYFPTDSIGYALSLSQGIIKTTDAGNTWTLQNSGLVQGYQYSTVYFMNKDTGFVSLPNGPDIRLLYTYDGGQVWNSIIGTVHARGVYGTKNVVYAIRHTAYRSTDVGQSWSGVPMPGNIWERLFAVNDTTVFALGRGALNGDPCGFNHGLFGRSTDGGQTWDTTEFHCPNGATDLEFPNTTRGYITNATDRHIRITKDGGVTWTLNHVDTGITTIVGVGCTDSLTCYLVTADGKIYKTSNGGAVGLPGQLPEKYAVLVYPNPFSESTTITLKSENPLIFDIVMYDQLGREVRRIEQIAQKDVTFTRDDLKTGIYFYRIIDFTDKRPLSSGKMIIQ